MSTRGAVVFVVVTGVCAAVAIGATVKSVSSERAATAAAPKPTAAAGDLLAADAAADRPLIVFRDLDRSRYGRLAFAEVGPGGTASTPPQRLALRPRPLRRRAWRLPGPRQGLLNESTVKLLDSRLDVTARGQVPGVPSRARVSRDGRLAAVTTFVTGHSYATPGQFSTAATLIDVRRGKVDRRPRALHTLDAEGDRVTAARPQLLGHHVRAATADTFYATVAYGGETHLVRGDVRTAPDADHPRQRRVPVAVARTARASGTRSSSRPARARRRSGTSPCSTSRPCARRRSPSRRRATTRLEWLDDDHVLYGNGEEIWTVPADGSGAPERYLPAADSPAVAG